MKKIFSLLFLILISLCSCYSGEEKDILNSYVELSKEDYGVLYDNLSSDNVFVSLDYQSVLDKIKSKDTFCLVVGGYWCPNCQAAMPFINKKALELEMSIYQFDTRIGTDKTADNDIRNCFTKSSKALYKKFIDKTQYVNSENVKSPDTDIDRMPVPTLLAFKDGILKGTLTREYYFENGILTDKVSSTDLSTDYLNEIEDILLFCK